MGFDDQNQLKPFEGNALFINGQLSVKNDDSVYRKYFPNGIIVNVEGAGHYVHTDKPKITVETIAIFLENIEKGGIK